MGKKTQKRQQHTITKDNIPKKLSPLKRNELNQLIEKLLQLGFNPSISATNQWNQYVQMQSLLSRIKDIESDLKLNQLNGNYNQNRLDAVEKFIEWAKENGALFDAIRITEFPDVELGLEAVRDLQQYEIFATVPKRMILSLDNVSTAIAPMMSQLPMIESMQNVKLAFSLLVERLNSLSFWKPYIDILPEKYSTVMNFTVTEMEELKGSSALPAALNQCKNIARQYAFINKFIQNVREDKSDPLLNMLKDKFTYELYCWAISTVMTRQNAIPKTTTAISNGDSIASDPTQDGQSMPALIPLWDLANHTDGIVTSSYNAEKEHIEGAALIDYKKGDQVFIYYGVRSNTNFLVHNGFVYPENSTDCVSIRLGLSTADPLYKQRSKLLDSIGIPSTCELDVLPLPIYISPKLLGFVRVFNMNEDHLNHWLSSERSTDLLHLDCALETALETKTWTFLKMRLTLLLKAFPTTLAEDRLLLENHRNGQNRLNEIHTMIVVFRITEKQILTGALEYVEERTKV